MTVTECWTKYSDGDVPQIQAIQCIVMAILQITIRIAGLAAFIMMIAGGFKYLTAGGDPKKAEEAQKTLTYAVLGLALLLGGWFILRFISEFTGVDVTQFNIPES